MTVVADIEANNILTNPALKPADAIEELDRMPFDGRAFTTRAGAKDLIRELNAIYTKSNIDPTEREAAEQAMLRVIDELKEDDEEDGDDLDDDQPSPQAAASVKDNGNDAVVTPARSVASVKSEVTKPRNADQDRLTPTARIDTLIGIAATSPVAFGRIAAIDAIDQLIENGKGLTQQQVGELRRIQNEGPENVREVAGEVAAKATSGFHHPALHAPKPGGPVLAHGDGKGD